MQIQTHQPARRRQRCLRPAPQAAPDFVPVAGGTLLGAATGALGVYLAREHGPAVVNSLIEKGLPYVLNGQVSPRFAFKALPYLQNLEFQRTVTGLAFGLAGFAAGAFLLAQRSTDE